MAQKTLTGTNIPEDEVDEIIEAFEALGGTDIKKTKQPGDDKLFTVEATFPD